MIGASGLRHMIEAMCIREAITHRVSTWVFHVNGSAINANTTRTLGWDDTTLWTYGTLPGREMDFFALGTNMFEYTIVRMLVVSHRPVRPPRMPTKALLKTIEAARPPWVRQLTLEQPPIERDQYAGDAPVDPT